MDRRESLFSIFERVVSAEVAYWNDTVRREDMVGREEIVLLERPERRGKMEATSTTGCHDTNFGERGGDGVL